MTIAKVFSKVNGAYPIKEIFWLSLVILQEFSMPARFGHIGQPIYKHFGKIMARRDQGAWELSWERFSPATPCL
jgi:hypothetical protein